MKESQVACKLTSQEFRKRKETIIARLQALITETVPTDKGYKFCFPGTDEAFDLVTEFVKSERVCCPFFHFTISVGEKQEAIWLHLSGQEDTKEFIQNELGFVDRNCAFKIKF